MSIVADALDALLNYEYCIIKEPDFTSFAEGSDIDIFCVNPIILTRSLVPVLTETLLASEYIEIEEKNGSHVYLDVRNEDDIKLRFDLYGETPPYERIRVKPELHTYVIDKRVKKTWRIGDRCISYWSADEMSENVIRYLEYSEWYRIRPDKIKHLHYIVEKLPKSEKQCFFDLVHRFTALPDTPKLIAKTPSLWGYGLELFRKMRKRGIKYALKRLISRL